MVTMSPMPTPRRAKSRATRLAEASNWDRVTDSSPQVIARRCGSAMARLVRCSAYETVGMTPAYERLDRARLGERSLSDRRTGRCSHQQPTRVWAYAAPSVNLG